MLPSLEVITLVMVCVVQLTDEMLEAASDKRDEAMAAMADGNFLHSCYSLLLTWRDVMSRSMQCCFVKKRRRD